MSTMTIERNDVSQLRLRGRSQSPVRGASSSPARRVPSPLRNAQFRPIAMNYAASPTTPQSCQYFRTNYKEEKEPIGAPGGFCASVRTVGYSTVGGKTFMSGKCPHCNRMVKSDNQICTPNASPPPSPWKFNLQSPLRSPIRSAKSSDGHATLQSPLRSPFKGSFFGKGQSREGNGKQASNEATTMAGSTNEAGKADSTTKLENSPSQRLLARKPRGRSSDSRSVSKSPRGRSPGANPSSRTPWRGRALSAKSSSPVRTPGGSTRGPRSPRPLSPMHSPWKGAAFFEGADERSDSNNSMSIGKSRGAHSPGPRNPLVPVGPLRVNVDIMGPEEEDERREAEEKREAVAAATSKQHNEGVWKSPLRSPFKGGLFGRGNKSGEKAAPLGSE